MGEIILFYRMKIELTEKGSLIGQGKDLAYLQALRLIKAGMHQLPANPLALVLFRNGQRAYLCQIFPGDMEGADALNAVIVQDNKVAQLVIERADGAAQKQALGGKLLQEVVDILDIAHPGRTDGDPHDARCSVASAICCTIIHYGLSNYSKFFQPTPLPTVGQGGK